MSATQRTWEVLELVRRPRGPRSWTTHLKSVLGLSPLKLALLHEVLGSQGVDDPLKLALALKALPLTLVAPRPNRDWNETSSSRPFSVSVIASASSRAVLRQ